ncbi:MAG: hypothetical protein HC831_20900 [Chloroflexia bacterium]|nr:hypothetical protein [Chloroflexia bacterium]
MAYIADNGMESCTPLHSVTVIANQPGAEETGYWSKADADNTCTIVTSADNITDVSDLPGGQTELIWTVRNSLCTNSDHLVITNNYHRHTTPAVAALPNPLCQNFTYVFGDLIPLDGTGTWSSTSPGVTFDDLSNAATSVRNLPKRNNFCHLDHHKRWLRVTFKF